jgi:predicted helicase
MEYFIGGRSILDWIEDRYRVKLDKDSAIANDPNEFSDDPEYIVQLIERLSTVAKKTMEIRAKLPKLRIMVEA